MGQAIMSSWSGEVNMINCYNHRESFFNSCRHTTIHQDVLISYWMMAGYVGPVDSAEKAYAKGQVFLAELIHEGVLKLSDKDREIIEPNPNPNPSQKCKHESRPCVSGSHGFVDVFDLSGIESVVLADGMLKRRKGSAAGDGNYLCRQLHESSTGGRGLRYIAQYSPTPYSMKPLLENVESPSVLVLRGCGHLFLMSDFTFEKLKTLVVLEISSSSLFTTIPTLGTISKLTQLRYLHLSDPLIPYLPGYFLSELRELCWLILRGCSRLCFNLTPKTQCKLDKLKVLDLSYTSTEDFPYLEQAKNLTHLFLRDSKLWEPEMRGGKSLVVLDLSRAEINSLPGLANMVHLHDLRLRECTGLKLVSGVEELTNLEFLDLSGCESLTELPQDLCNLKNLTELNLSGCSCLGNLREGLFDQMSRLVKLDLSATKVKRLPSFVNLTNLRNLSLRGLELDSLEFETWTSLSNLEEVDLHGLTISSLQELNLDFLQSLGKLKIFIPPKTSVEKLESLKELDCQDLNDAQRTISKPGQFHIVCDARVDHLSVFDRFIHELGRLDAFISDIPRKSRDIKIAITDNQAKLYKGQLKALLADWKYIQENLHRLKSSRNRKSSEELLRKLLDASTNLSATDFEYNSQNLKRLLRVLVKLKLLLPTPTKVNDEEASKREQPSMKSSMDKQISNKETDLHSCYQSLTENQKNCLLCFSAFPCSEDAEEKGTTGVLMKRLVVKKRVLISWWVGEGFIDPRCDHVEEASSSTQDPYPSSTMETLKTYEDVGEHMLKVLREKHFIEPVIMKSRETSSVCMNHHVHSFVATQARNDGFFDSNMANSSWLAPYFTRSDKDLKSVVTLFNINESAIKIKPEWLSKMKHMSVLYLGNWRCSENAKQVEIVEQKFLDCLNNMRRLKVFSLQGSPAITKLPDSVCKLTNLIILDLSNCTHLEELPTSIGLLGNLTYLDMINCPLLTKLPKGICLLSKLEVLKGFAVTHQAIADRHHHWLKKTKRFVNRGLFSNKNNIDHNEACTLRDLSKIEKLRKLSLVVNMFGFPYPKDLEAFKEMTSLRKLKICWEGSFSSGMPYLDQSDSSFSYSGETAKPFNCWERQTHDPQETSRTINHLDKIQKLELWCFPGQIAPRWLDPTELKSLEKLYIVGGNLERLQDTRSNKCGWNVKTLRLMHLPYMSESWNVETLMDMFGHLKYMEIHQCQQLKFPECDEEGVWIPHAPLVEEAPGLL